MKIYRGMYKKYFELNDRQAAFEMATRLRESESAIAPEFAILEAPAFILYCDEMLHELAQIRKTGRAIDALASNLPTVAKEQFLRQAMIEEIHQTNEVENIHSTRNEIDDEISVIENGQKGKRFDGMIRKYRLLLGGDEIPLDSCQDVRNLYDSFVLDEVVKENAHDAPDGVYFRKSPVAIVKNGHTVHHGVFPEARLNESMARALDFLNDGDYDPLIRIAAFHYMFGYLHPFYNGNGRMARFISSCRLTMEGVHLLVALRLSFVIKSHRTQYYEMFKTTNDKRNFGDMTRFVVEFLRFINEAGRQVLGFLTEKAELISHYGEVIRGLNLSEQAETLLFILVQVSVCESRSLSPTELSRASGESMYIVNRLLREEIAPFCAREKKGRSTLHRADLEKLDDISG